MNDGTTPAPVKAGARHAIGAHAHLSRLAIADQDFAAADSVDVATASRVDLALAFEQLRSAFNELRLMEREHHPDA